MDEPTLRDLFRHAAKSLSANPGTARSLSLGGQKFSARRNADGTISLSGLALEAKTPPLRNAGHITPNRNGR